MNHDETIRDLQELISDIDRELATLRATLREGERIREELLKQAMALEWESGCDPAIIRIVRKA